jgi:hypothetical protein
LFTCFHCQGFGTEVTTGPVPCHCVELHKELVDCLYSGQIPTWASILMSPKLGNTRLQHYAWQICVYSHKHIMHSWYKVFIYHNCFIDNSERNLWLCSRLDIMWKENTPKASVYATRLLDLFHPLNICLLFPSGKT